jgi:hypothetical protein
VDPAIGLGHGGGGGDGVEKDGGVSSMGGSGDGQAEQTQSDGFFHEISLRDAKQNLV